MKKLLLVLLLVASIMLCACSNKKNIDKYPAELVHPSADVSVDESQSDLETETEYEGKTYVEAEILRLTKLTTPIDAGDEVTLSISGIPNTRYDIYVYYSKNPVESDDLAPRYSDGDGNITWKWTIPSSIKEGRREIAIVGGGEILRVYLDIT